MESTTRPKRGLYFKDKGYDFHIRLTKEQYDFLDELSRESGLSRADVVRSTLQVMLTTRREVASRLNLNGGFDNGH